jgi:nicotinamide-nucleotide amidase
VAITNEILGLVSDIHDSLRARGETLSTAESLTAGGLSNALTIVPGASDVFLGSITAYRPDIKTSHLGVAADTISEHTVVSEQVAIEMGIGANKSFGSTWAIATTGVAGPGPSDGSEAVSYTHLTLPRKLL